MFGLFRSAARKSVSAEKLPVLHSFVDVAVGGRRMRSVSIEELNPRYVAVNEVVGRAGERSAIVYHTASGKFRLGTTIADVKDGMTYFQLPGRVEMLAGGGQKRTSVRLDTLVSGVWRMAPDGKGVGEFMKGSIRDISRGGCAIIMSRQCRVGQWLEIKMALKHETPAVAVVGEIVRCEQVPTSGKFSHGLRFHGLTPAQDHQILEFINRKQTELRSRGLA